MKIKMMLAAMLFVAPALASAHEVWIERDGDGPARIYLGEPGEPKPAGGDPEFAKLKAPKLLPATAAAMTRKAGYLEVAVPRGDVRAWDDNVFAPWGPEGKREAVVYYARAGRSGAGATMPLEIAPVSAAANSFVVTRAGQPLTNHDVTHITPQRVTRTLKTDAQGVVALTSAEPGRHLLSAATKDEGKVTVGGSTVQTLHRITTTTFTVD
ncbi:DUF4198 domain-containing protein [Sphingomonas sp. BK235]|uniref:DUF4198 domain-containing protein n=1 Tax=Sphingomonas sp. BK235 TaxID=2512131 RepID=UPI0010E3E5BB|nr:DUF4198 domain-containing protein [Sphingomonas sp. BK235]TCP37535.1 hypothetical protein EV292_1011059 [Sphingomonas sp. BK235]